MKLCTYKLYIIEQWSLLILCANQFTYLIVMWLINFNLEVSSCQVQ